MNWHHPDLYFFLCLAGSLAAFLVPSIIDDELLARRRKSPLVEPRTLDREVGLSLVPPVVGPRKRACSGSNVPCGQLATHSPRPR